MDLNISSSCQDSLCTLAVRGEIDVANADSFREALMGLLEDSQKDVVIDLTEAPYIDSTGIGVMMGAAHRAEELNRSIKLVCPHENIVRVLNMLGVDKQLTLVSKA